MTTPNRIDTAPLAGGAGLGASNAIEEDSAVPVVASFSRDLDPRSVSAMHESSRRSGSAEPARCSQTRTGKGTRPKPWNVAALERLRSFALKPSENLVARAMLEFGGPKSPEVWPSMPTLAQRTGLSVRSVRNAVRSIESRNLIRAVRRSRGGVGESGRGITNRWRLTFAEASASPAKAAGFDPTRQSAAGNPANCAREHGIRCRETIQPDFPKNSPLNGNTCRSLPSEMVGGNEPPNSRAMLIARGVRGKYLDRLCHAPAVTPELIDREWNVIADDRGVRSKPAVLVRRLAQLGGVEIRKRAPLPAAALDAIGRIEANRRRQMQTA